MNTFILKDLHKSVINPFSIALAPSEQKIKATFGFSTASRYRNLIIRIAAKKKRIKKVSQAI